MNIKVFSAWGECVDVGINIEKSDEDIARFTQPERFTFVTLTVVEARAMAYQLLACADQAERDEQDYAGYLNQAIDNQPVKDYKGNS